MSKIAIIGGTGLTTLNNLTIISRESMQTPYGEPSGPLTFGEIDGVKTVFLARHGDNHSIPPHRVNYRANMWALQKAGSSYVIAVNAVGGITPKFKPVSLVIPDQIIDYTHSREHTYFDDTISLVDHIDFSKPYSSNLRECIIRCAEKNNITLIESGTYAVTQGPRLESAAEILKLGKDGCDIVGMTGMPETALAKELNLNYCSLAVVANYAAGKSDGEISMDNIEENLHKALVYVKKLLEHVVVELNSEIQSS